MSMQRKFVVRCVAWGVLATVCGASRAVAAPPLVLYDPASSSAGASDLKSGTSYPGGSGEPCGLSTPCTDLNTAAAASVTRPLLAAPFLGGMPYGISGVASAGVSNHGQGGEIGVLAWVKPTDDTTLSLGVSVGASRWDGRGFTVVPVPARH